MPKTASDELIIAPVKIQTRGDRYTIEIPKEQVEIAKELRGKSLKVTIKVIDFSKV